MSAVEHRGIPQVARAKRRWWVRHMQGRIGHMANTPGAIPRRAVARTARMASLPLGYAGRSAVGIGKRIGGKPAEVVATEIQMRTAEQMFKVLGELKGGAMEVVQALSVFEAVLP